MIILSDVDTAKVVRRVIRLLVAHDEREGNSQEIDDAIFELSELFDALSISDAERDQMDLEFNQEP